MVEVKITERARRWGYVYWSFRQDEEIAGLLGKRESIDVVFMNAPHGKKKIDWKFRRISLGWRWTRNLPDTKKCFVLTLTKPNTLDIQCR